MSKEELFWGVLSCIVWALIGALCVLCIVYCVLCIVIK